jgi:hypothetical protein
MRLTDAKMIRLEDFVDTDVLPYAILSHTWTKEVRGDLLPGDDGLTRFTFIE